MLKLIYTPLDTSNEMIVSDLTPQLIVEDS